MKRDFLLDHIPKYKEPIQSLINELRKAEQK